MSAGATHAPAPTARQALVRATAPKTYADALYRDLKDVAAEQQQSVARKRQDAEPAFALSRQANVDLSDALRRHELATSEYLAARSATAAADRKLTFAMEAFNAAMARLEEISNPPPANLGDRVGDFVDGLFESIGWKQKPAKKADPAENARKQVLRTERASSKALEEWNEALEAESRALDLEIAARTRVESVRKHAVTAESSAAQARADLSTVEIDFNQAYARAEEARVRAEQANLRYDRRRQLLDQHLLRVSGTPAERAAYREAAKRYQLTSAIESKPQEISQDALATAPELGRFAIADGVTNSDLSGEWARTLVSRWTREPISDVSTELAPWLARAQAEWNELVAPELAQRSAQFFNRGRKWVGHAAFVGAELKRETHGGWRLDTVAIGDSVIFHVSGGRLRESFPLEESSEFSDVVKTLPSTGAPAFRVRQRSLRVEAGDDIFMATDALAAWILTEIESGRDGFEILRGIQNRSQMSRFVTEARAGQVAGRGKLHVDDTSFVRFVVPSN
jgi:hypothetical protein